MKYSFDQLPFVLAKIEERLEKIEEILLKQYHKDTLESDFISSKEACSLLKISLATLYTKVYLRQIPFYKKGNRLHFKRDELLGWIKEGRRKTYMELKEEGEVLLRNLKVRNNKI